MGFLDKVLSLLDTDKTSQMTVANPNTIFKEALKHTSGNQFTRELKYNLFYQIYAFKGICEGVGCSTIVANTALAIADAGLSVCVIDTSILKPVQDVLLKTSVEVDTDENLEKALDWFDLPYHTESPLHLSSYNRNISVLSFKGKHRGVVDFLSTADTAELVELALAQLHTKFDIILIDCCDELSSVNTACLQQAHQVIQVWNDTPTVISNLENHITNSITLSCPLDKMRYVIYSKICSDIINTDSSLNKLVNQYRCKHLGTSYFSEDIYRNLVNGKPLYQLSSEDKALSDYTECIISIACHILNIRTEETNIGSFTVDDIMNGKVDGTLSKSYKDANDEVQYLVRHDMGELDNENEDDIIISGIDTIDIEQPIVEDDIVSDEEGV